MQVCVALQHGNRPAALSVGCSNASEQCKPDDALSVGCSNGSKQCKPDDGQQVKFGVCMSCDILCSCLWLVHTGMEAVIANLLEPGDKIIVGVNGIWVRAMAGW
jgi:hypothetical protein